MLANLKLIKEPLLNLITEKKEIGSSKCRLMAKKFAVLNLTN